MIPLIGTWIYENPGLLMQDRGPSHSSMRTRTEPNQIMIFTMTWPAYSPELDLNENVWNQMNDYIEQKYSDLPNGQGG